MKSVHRGECRRRCSAVLENCSPAKIVFPDIFGRLEHSLPPPLAAARPKIHKTVRRKYRHDSVSRVCDRDRVSQRARAFVIHDWSFDHNNRISSCLER